MNYLKYICCNSHQKLHSFHLTLNLNKIVTQKYCTTHSNKSLNLYKPHYSSKYATLHHCKSPVFTLNVNKQSVWTVFHRSFKTSEPRNIHPIVWFIVKPFLKLTAVLSGRGFRKWWKDLPNDRKAYFLNVIKTNKNKLLVAFLIFSTLFATYYVSHLEDTPITGRRRFMAFNHKQLEEINEFELKKVLGKLEPHIIPANHPITRRVEAIVTRILKANGDIREVQNNQWKVFIIDNSIENAFVLPTGHVFVFTGMLKLCSNDDQLGTILAHEIAHCLQNHGAENVSFTHFLDLISIIIIAAIWAIVPSDLISILTHWLYNKLIQISLELPYNRKIETEADRVGLFLAAKACFDVRESTAFWSKMAIIKGTFGTDTEIEFLSTHPTHENRSQYLDSIMDKAIKKRQDCGCPNLSLRDPRLDVEGVGKALERARKQFLELNPKPNIAYKE